MNANNALLFLNKLYSLFDDELKNYPAITKLKTIGSTYMIASGLFSDSSINHAQVMIDYALKLIDLSSNHSLDEKVHFQVIIGINTGGPVNCGILGHTRPVFDIIGDAVNIASRMNSTCVPGFIQIPDTTYDLIKFLKYNVRERGEIFIKGKGQIRTYLLSGKPFTNKN